MMRVFLAFWTFSVAVACPSSGKFVFDDTNDKDQKMVSFEGKTMTITNYPGKAQWTVTALMDDKCVASVDFCVKGKDACPRTTGDKPVPLQAAVTSSGGNVVIKFTDPNMILVEDSTEILNTWTESLEVACPSSGKLVFDDTNDKDQKMVSFEDKTMTITNYPGETQWTVKALLDDTCVASVDFCVEGKDACPRTTDDKPVPLQAAVTSGGGKVAIKFTDPSMILVEDSAEVLNTWTENLKIAAAHPHTTMML